MIITRKDMTVELVRSDALDEHVIFAAKVSTLGEQTQLLETKNDISDEKFINFLMKNRHGSPFEHNSMTFFIQAPIFVFREFHRHRVGWSYNEESGRYTQLSPVFYLPSEGRNLVQIGKAGSYDFIPGSYDQYQDTQALLLDSYDKSYHTYLTLLEKGIAREIARACLPVAIYSSMYATCNARSLMNFLSLRTKHANSSFPSYPQREIEMVAEKMEEAWAQLMPITHRKFTENGRIAP